jgi:hypothetical protein
MSYFPLFLVLFIKFFNYEFLVYCIKYWRFIDILFLLEIKTLNGVMGLISTLLLLISLFSILFILFELRTTEKKRIGQKRYTIKKIQPRDRDILVYLVTYVLPLISLDMDNFRDIIVLFVLIILIFWLSMYSDLLYVNPVMAALKLRIYAIETDLGEALLISKNDKFEECLGKKIICYRFIRDKETVLIDGSRGQQNER